MNELQLKYGCNPNQKPSRIFMEDGSDLPIQVLSGRPGYINFLDAFNSWQLVKELKEATGMVCATSFKHVSPTSAALGLPLDAAMQKMCFVDDIEGLNDSPLACAYARARGTDRMSSFGDWIALSDVCDVTTAKLIKREVSDGIIAPGYEPEALEILKSKKKGNYNIVAIDPAYVPDPVETKEVYGITFEQGRNDYRVTPESLDNVVTAASVIPDSGKRDLTVALITLKYTQSNSVCYAVDGQAIGVGAGQQSRIHCTRLAGNKADIWHLRRHPKVLALPFLPTLGRPDRDNVIDVYISDQGSRAYPLPPTRSSRSGTTSNGRAAAVCPISRSRAAVSVTIRSSKPATNTALPCASRGCACSIIDRKTRGNGGERSLLKKLRKTFINGIKI